MKRFAIWAVLISATAPLASAKVLVEIAVADAADFEALRRGREDRFVFVNISKYKESATLDECPVVKAITPEGVILEYLGTGFLLPRE